MKLLLDTHTFIWWDSTPSQLSPHVLTLCQDPAHTVYLSVVSVWELQIKAQLGKVTLRLPLAEIIAHQQQTNHLLILDIGLAHVLALAVLPPSHKDPFDRLLVTQATLEGAVLLSRDPIFAQYPVQVVW